jgi:hypothetical protein
MATHIASDISIESSNPNANPGFINKWWTPQLAGPVIAATVVRLALMTLLIARKGVVSFSQGDTMSYLEPGRNLLLHGRFVADGVPDLVRTPGYPLFLAITSLAGLPAAALANVILSVFSVILVWRLGLAVFSDKRIALGAAWIFAFEPVSIALSVVLLSESLFLALFLLSMERLAFFLREPRLLVLMVAGLWLAAATFARPVTYYLPVALAVGLFLVFVRVPGLRWKAPAVLLISVLPWLAAWQIRNKIETGYSGFSSITEINLYYYDAVGVMARVERHNWIDAMHELGYVNFSQSRGQIYLYQPYLALHPEQSGWNQAQRLAFMHAEAVRIIKAHYGSFMHNCLLALFKTGFEPGAAYFVHLLNPEVEKHTAGLVLGEGVARGGIILAKTYPWIAAEKAALGVALLCFYIFAARGVFRGGMHNANVWLLLGTSLYFFTLSAVGAGPGADSRFRLPVMPVVCIFAAAGFLRRKTIAQ